MKTVREFLHHLLARVESLDDPLLVDAPSSLNGGKVVAVRRVHEEPDDWVVVLVVDVDAEPKDR